METKDTERQQRFIGMATAHATDFQTRVAQHDRENSFPFENVEAMKASGYTSMTVAAVQVQAREIEALHAELAALRREVDRLATARRPGE